MDRPVLKLKRGMKDALPDLQVGELGYTIDTRELFVGTADGNQLLNNSDFQLAIDEHTSKGVDDDVHGLSGKVIKESGINENGSYIKFTDGTMICYSRVYSIDITEEMESGVMRTSATDRATWVYPEPFVSIPDVFAECQSTSFATATPFSPTAEEVYIYGIGYNGEQHDLTVSVFAIGKYDDQMDSI